MIEKKWEDGSKVNTKVGFFSLKDECMEKFSLQYVILYLHFSIL